MKGRDFIITGLQSWDIPIGSNAIDIAKEISKNNRVLYINTPLDHMTILRKQYSDQMMHRLEVIKKKADPIRRINDSLWVLDFPFAVAPVNTLPDGILFDWVNKQNNKKIFAAVKKTADHLGFKNFIHFIDNDIYRSLYSKDFLDSALSVYYRRDNLQPYQYWKKHVARIEPKLIAKSDLVLCNSPQYTNFCLPHNPKSITVGQGVDLTLYDSSITYKIPKEIEEIPSPRIGYIGDITSVRLDPDLLYELAKSKPHYSFVLIGGEDSKFQAHELHNLSNVYFTGLVPKSQVAHYITGIDVCLNPQLLNEVTIGNYPRKIDEYLALGKPVIATKTKAMDLFKKHTYLCENLAEYQDAIEKALKDNSLETKQERIRFAHSHSWPNNIERIYHVIQQFIK